MAALVPQPALAYSAYGARHQRAGQGWVHDWRISLIMATQALSLRPTLSRGALLRGLRNALIGLVVFLIVGNLVIFSAFQLLSRTADKTVMPAIPSIENLTEVDSRLWRGSAPSEAGYSALAEHGVKVIVDLRAEDLKVDEALIESLGMQLVRIPLRDGQAPTGGDVETFLATMRESEGLVYVHCGAGVGRTGTMAASYLVGPGQASGLEALKRNLSVGPPSLEQIAFAAGLERGESASSNPLFTALSRVLDAPRRMLVRIRGSYR